VAALVFALAAIWFLRAPSTPRQAEGQSVPLAGAGLESAAGPTLGGSSVIARERCRVGLGWLLALSSLIALGAWAVQAKDSGDALPSLSRFTDGRQVMITARVVRDGVLRGRGRWKRQSVDVQTEEIVDSGNATPVAALVRVSIYTDGDFGSGDRAHNETTANAPAEVFIYGQRLRFPAKLREPRNFQNPGAADFRGYLRRQGIVATTSVAGAKIELLSGTAGTIWDFWGSRARRSVIGRIHALWYADDAALFDAILIGDRSGIDRDTNAAWQRTGLYHILVVSGLKVGILAFFFLWVLRRLHANEWVATAFTLLPLFAYAYVTEMGAPVLRSVLMVAVFLVTRLFYRGRAQLNALGAAALVLLTIDPRALFDPSFQLTFFCMLAIVGLGVPILERTSEPIRRGLRYPSQTSYDYLLPPRIAQFRLEIRMLAERCARLTPFKGEKSTRVVTFCLSRLVHGGVLIYDTLVLSFVSQVTMTLPMAVYFHRGTIAGLPANSLAVPLTGILMPASAIALGLSYIWLPLAKIPASVAAWSLAGISWSADIFGRMRFGDLRLPTPELAPALALVTALAIAMLLVRSRALLTVSALTLLATASAWLTVFPARPKLIPGVLEVTAIDVGQAESTLLVTPEGRTVLVDAAGSLGPWESDFDFGENVIAPYLWSRGLSHLDAIVLTHSHSDHIGGMPGVVASFHPRELWLGPNPETPALRRLKRAMENEQAMVIRRNAGERFVFGGAAFEVMAPSDDWRVALTPANNDSLVIRVSFGKTSALLTGDVDKKVERELVKQQIRAEVLKVAHNGSATSTTPEFLSAVRPQFAVIFAGAHNSFGHPRREVLERLAQSHVVTYRTDTLGASTFILDGTSVRARSWVTGLTGARPIPAALP
jgi:competence protein ComEC